jgi:hypothetical protein
MFRSQTSDEAVTSNVYLLITTIIIVIIRTQQRYRCCIPMPHMLLCGISVDAYMNPAPSSQSPEIITDQ